MIRKIESKRPKLVLAKNKAEFEEYLAKYQLDREDYIFLEGDPFSLASVLKFCYGIVLTGNYKENKLYPDMRYLIDNGHFKIVQYMNSK